MTKTLVISVIMLITFTQESLAWGRAGHDAIAAIAERNLTPKAKKNIEKYLGGNSIIYYASWMDYYRHYPAYAETHYWHMAPVNEDLRYTDDLKHPQRGNAIYGLEYAIENLKNYKNLTDSMVAVNLYYVIHIVGDFHCPIHIVYPDKKNFFVQWGSNPKVSYHKIWDETVIEGNHRWSYTEFADQLNRLSKKEIKKIQEGTPRDWLYESAIDCRIIYDMASPEQQLSTEDHRFLNDAKPIALSQIQKAGYRLAKVLNDLFG